MWCVQHITNRWYLGIWNSENFGVRVLYLKAEPYFISEVPPSAFVMLCANFVVTRRRD